MTVHAMIFDVFGTCVDWRSGVASVMRRYFEAQGIDTDPEDFAVAWRRQYQPAMARIRSGNRGYVPLDMLHRENLETVLDQFGLQAAVPSRDRAMLNRAWEQLPPWPDVAEGLATLKRDLIIAPCSNGSIALMTRLAKFGHLPWDCILGADIAQDYKPQPPTYLASAKALGLDPEQVMMVAAHNDDLIAAQALGFKTGFVPRPTEHGPDQTTDLAPTGDYDLVSADFISLAHDIRSLTG